MIIILKSNTIETDVKMIAKEVVKGGFKKVTPVYGDGSTVLNCVGKLSEDRKVTLKAYLEGLPNVETVMIVGTPLRLSSRRYHPADLIVRVNGVAVGGSKLIIIAGPCAVESRKQILTAAKEVQENGADMLRGGAFKPRTSPYDFQGLGERGLKLLVEAKQATGLPIVTEVMCPGKIKLVEKYADVLQVGARNMHNFKLLEALGKTKRTILLKRGLAATLNELLGAAEYILAGGNNRVILCLRGIGGQLFAGGGKTRNIPDLGDIPVLKSMTHLPVLFDPSHAGGRRELVEPLSLAAIGAGADGLIIEVHPDPDQALCDGAQSLNKAQFRELMKKAGVIAKAVGKS